MPQPFIVELSKLQDAVPPSDWQQVKATIESELGGTIESLFKSVREKALASASVAQVHRGVLKDGTDIVVKVSCRSYYILQFIIIVYMTSVMLQPLVLVSMMDSVDNKCYTSKYSMWHCSAIRVQCVSVGTTTA
jgi:ubiquinone biosynthesis protein